MYSSIYPIKNPVLFPKSEIYKFLVLQNPLCDVQLFFIYSLRILIIKPRPKRHSHPDLVSLHLFFAQTPNPKRTMDLLDWDEIFDRTKKEFPNLTLEDLESAKKVVLSEEDTVKMVKIMYWAKVDHISSYKSEYTKYGPRAVETRPLVQLISIALKGKEEGIPIPHSIYGQIKVEFEGIKYDIYNRTENDKQTLGDDGMLRLEGPSDKFSPGYMIYNRSCIVSKLHDENGVVLYDDEAYLIGSDGEVQYDEVYSNRVYCQELKCINDNLSLFVEYAAIPFGVYARVHISFYPRPRHSPAPPDFINVYGQVTAHHVSPYETHPFEEYILFKKPSTEYEKVAIDIKKRMKLFRCWVALPAHPELELVVSVNLLDHETQKNRIHCKVKLGCEHSINTNCIDVGDGILMLVEVHPFSPDASGPDDFYAEEYLKYEATQSSATEQIHQESLPATESSAMELDDEKLHDSQKHLRSAEPSDMQLDDECSPSSLSYQGKRKVTDIHNKGEDEFDGEERASKEMGFVSTTNPVWMRRHKPSFDEPSRLKPPLQTRPAMEIFSIFIGQKVLEPLQIYGSIVVSLENFYVDGEFETFYSAVKETPLSLDKKLKFLPICKGSVHLKSSTPYKLMTFDIRDVAERVAIKGHVDFSPSFLQYCGFYKQLCSVIHGDKGFAAVHYSIFKAAVQAKITVILRGIPNNPPKVHGKISARYHDYDISSRYDREHYRMELFNRSEDDPVSVDDEAEVQLTLCRDVVVVPLDSNLILDVELNPEKFPSSSRMINFVVNDKKVWNAGACYVTFRVEWSYIV